MQIGLEISEKSVYIYLYEKKTERIENLRHIEIEEWKKNDAALIMKCVSEFLSWSSRAAQSTTYILSTKPSLINRMFNPTIFFESFQ